MAEKYSCARHGRVDDATAEAMLAARVFIWREPNKRNLASLHDHQGP